MGSACPRYQTKLSKLSRSTIKVFFRSFESIQKKLLMFRQLWKKCSWFLQNKKLFPAWSIFTFYGKKSTFLGEFREFCLSFLFLRLDHGKNSRVVLNQNKRQSLYPAYWNLFTRVRGEQHLLVSDWKVGYDLEDNNLYSQLDINPWALGICFTSVPQPVPKGIRWTGSSLLWICSDGMARIFLFHPTISELR